MYHMCESHGLLFTKKQGLIYKKIGAAVDKKKHYSKHDQNSKVIVNLH